MGESIRIDQRQRLQAEHDLRFVRKTTHDGERAAWLERDSVPDGFELPVPEEPPRFLRLLSDGPGGPFRPQPLLGGWNWTRIYSGGYDDMYRDILQRHKSTDAHEQIRALRAAVGAAKSEQARHEDVLAGTFEDCRRAVSAFLYIVSRTHLDGPLPPFPPERNDGRGYDDEGRLTLGGERIDQVTDLDPGRVLQHASLTLWKSFQWYHGERYRVATLKAVCDRFGVRELVRSTTEAALRYYGKGIADIMDTLARLACKRRFYESILSHVMLDREPPKTEEMKEEIDKTRAAHGHTMHIGEKVHEHRKKHDGKDHGEGNRHLFTAGKIIDWLRSDYINAATDEPYSSATMITAAQRAGCWTNTKQGSISEGELKGILDSLEKYYLEYREHIS